MADNIKKTQEVALALEHCTVLMIMLYLALNTSFSLCLLTLGGILAGISTLQLSPVHISMIPYKLDFHYPRSLSLKYILELFWKCNYFVNFLLFDCCHFTIAGKFAAQMMLATTWSIGLIYSGLEIPFFSGVHHC